MDSKGDPRKEGWEVSEFPILCDTCLGENPHVRMTKSVHGDECKVCARPFTIFRWCPGPKMRFKKTEICQACSKIKNVCQTCLLDLHYHLPVQVRDSLLKLENTVPKMEANRLYLTQKLDQELALRDGDSLIDYGKADPVGKEVLKSIARTKPYYKRNMPHVCSFFIKGTCNRGAECPYRHEIDVKDEQLKTQHIKDRYYGSNDPVASKILEKLPEHFESSDFQDTTITTLVLFGTMTDITDQALRSQFSTFGDIESIRIIAGSNCAFIKYRERIPAEAALDRFSNKGLKILNSSFKVAWAKAKKK